MERRYDETGRNEKKDCEMSKCNRRSDDDDHDHDKRAVSRVD